MPHIRAQTPVLTYSDHDLRCNPNAILVSYFPDLRAHFLKAQQWHGQERASGILLQEVPSHVDESAGPAIVGKFGDEGFSLLDEALDGC